MNKQVSPSAKRIVKTCITGQKWRIVLSSFLSTLASVTYVALALISKEIIDIATSQKQGKFTLLALAVILLIVFQLVCAAAVSHLRTASAGKMGINIRKNLFSALLTKQMSSISEYHSGDLLNRFSSDADIVVNSAASLIPSVTSLIAKIIAGAVAILLIDWKFAAGIIVIGIAVPAVCKLIGYRYRSLHSRYQQSEGRLRSFLQENFKNLAVIKSFPSLIPTHKKLGVLQSENYNLKIARNSLNIIYSTGMSLFFTAGYFLVLLWGAAGIKANTVTYGSLIAFLQIISQLRAPLQNISAIMPSYYSMLSSADRLAEIIDLKEEIKPLDKNMFDAINNVFTYIEAKDLCFSYEERQILRDTSFSLRRGSTAVITGESGVGKSTLFKLLLGYLETEKGTLRFDGKYDINSSTRAFFSYVPQGNMILSGTIRENITLCCASATKEDIDRAIKTAVLDKWIESLPKGIDTYIGEDGLGISEGQAQRIAIARAILCNAPILLLDEATAALDSETEAQLLLNIKELSNKTVLLVTHRALPQEIYDTHLHLEDGRITKIM